MTTLGELAATGLVETDVQIGSLTTYRLGGPARYLAEVSSSDGLRSIVEALADEPVLILGRGSNLVISDSGFEGLVIRLAGDFESIQCGPDWVCAGAAAWLPSVARKSVEAGLRGLEFFVGIPGSIGGAIRQNAGGHGSETRDRLSSVEVMSLRSGLVRESSPDDLSMSYRSSNIGSDELVLAGTFGVEQGSVEEGRRLIASIVRWRKEHQPSAVYNAGSVFRNPEGDSAGRLIDALGLKGFAVGGVAVSHKHANFFVATPEASAADLFELVRVVGERVAAATGIELIPEIQFVGEFDER